MGVNDSQDTQALREGLTISRGHVNLVIIYESQGQKGVLGTMSNVELEGRPTLPIVKERRSVMPSKMIFFW
jgi:hypothetical protein